MPDDVEIVSIEGRRLRFTHPATSTDEAMWSFSARLEGETFAASVGVWELGDGLARYFEDLASRWRGFDGELEYGSLEGNLTL